MVYPASLAATVTLDKLDGWVYGWMDGWKSQVKKLGIVIDYELDSQVMIN